jgi:organic hydroperoxide reductase OsmC/OhrA
VKAVPIQVKSHRFPVDVRWVGGKLTCAAVDGKPELAVATPPEFKGGVEGVWSPEDLLVASAATCFTVTLVSAAERRGLPLRALGVHGTGAVTQRPDGRFGFTAIELDAVIGTDPGYETEIRAAAEAAERSCLVAVSLDLPVHVALDVRTAAAA